MNKIIFSICCCALLQACASVSSVSRPDNYYSQNQPKTLNLDQNFSSVNSSENISKLLNHRITIPKQNRIAIVNLNKSGLQGVQISDSNQISDNLVENFILKLRSSERVYDASYLPAMLISPQRSIDSLRLSAARMQADLILTYQSLCGSFSDFNLFSKNLNKSYCTVEAVLIDVRSGLIALSSVSSQEQKTAESKQDLNIYELKRRSEIEATHLALTKVANDVFDFLESLKS